MSGRAAARRRGEVFRHGGDEYSVVRMPADGNCLFHSLAYCLRRSAAEHLAVRRQAVEYVAANWARRFGPVLGAFLRDGSGRPVRTAPGYADHMARLGVFGGDPELCAISEIYGVQIKVFVRRRPACAPHVYNERSRRAICLLFSGPPDHGHYDVALPSRVERQLPAAVRTGAAATAEGQGQDVAAAVDVLAYTVALSTFFILCVSLLVAQLSLVPVRL